MLVLDTHALLWWVDDRGGLSTTARTAIDAERARAGELVVSAISAWEIAMLVEKHRLSLSLSVDTWLSRVAAVEGVLFYPVDATIGMKSAALPGPFHKDPADRMIVATARELGAPLVTADEKIRHYRHVRSIW